MIEALVTIHDETDEEIYVGSIRLDSNMKTKDKIKFKAVRPFFQTKMVLSLAGCQSQPIVNISNRWVKTGETITIEWGDKPVFEFYTDRRPK